MERAKLQAHVRGLKPHFPESEGDECGQVGAHVNDMEPSVFKSFPVPPMYPNYGNKETCPPYYARWKIEPNTFNLINGVDTAVGNIIKYIMRHDGKDGLKDLYKARDYLNMMIEHHYGKDKV